MSFPNEFPDIFSIPESLVQEKLNLLTPEELANFAKESAKHALETLFKFYNDLLVKYKIQYYYNWKIDVVSK